MLGMSCDGSLFIALCLAFRLGRNLCIFLKSSLLKPFQNLDFMSFALVGTPLKKLEWQGRSVIHAEESQVVNILYFSSWATTQVTLWE